MILWLLLRCSQTKFLLFLKLSYFSSLLWQELLLKWLFATRSHILFFPPSFRYIFLLSFPLTALRTSLSPEHTHARHKPHILRKEWGSDTGLVVCHSLFSNSVTLEVSTANLSRKQEFSKLWKLSSNICEKKGSCWLPSSSLQCLSQVPTVWFRFTVAL